MTQTDTEWGRIWDALPPSFPKVPGSIPTETVEGPVSGSFAVPGGAQEAAGFMTRALQAAGYSIEAASGPSEDGSYVISANGPDPECGVQVTLKPLSGTTVMAVIFGAACPFS